MKQYFFQFFNPSWFFLLLFIPVMILVTMKSATAVKVYFSSTRLLASVPLSRKERFKPVVLILRLLSLALLVSALARPQWTNKTTENLTEGIDIMLTIDTSGSMKAEDFHLEGSEVNRLDVIKKVVDNFIVHRSQDRMAMVVFGEKAYTQCPLTFDKETIRTFLDWVHIGIAGDGTAIGNALAVSVKRLKDQPTKSKIIILLTDGRNNAGEVAPLMAAQIAKEYHIKVYTIGVGSRGPVPYPQETRFGTRRVFAQLDLDEDTLKEIAGMTGGEYFRATETEELNKIYQTIDQMEKTEIKVKEYQESEELYAPFLLAGLLLLLLEIYLSQTIFVRIP